MLPLQVATTTYEDAHCRTSHLTAFGTGFFTLPNTVDFDYIFAAASFEDNLTIYMTVIFTLCCMVSLLIWARVNDVRDKEKLVTHNCPDNASQDCYLYEILTFTGSWKGKI